MLILEKKTKKNFFFFKSLYIKILRFLILFKKKKIIIYAVSKDSNLKFLFNFLNY